MPTPCYALYEAPWRFGVGKEIAMAIIIAVAPELLQHL